MGSIKRSLSNYDIKVALKPYQNIGSLFPKPKDPIPKDCLRFGASISWESSKILPASVEVKIGVTDVFWNHGRLISARIRSIGTTAFICRMSV